MKKVCILLKTPPYGTEKPSEALRHALEGISEGMEVSMVLLDSGVYCALRGQKAPSSGEQTIAAGIEKCLAEGVLVYAEGLSLRKRHMDEGTLIEGIEVLNSPDACEVIKAAEATIIF